MLSFPVSSHRILHSLYGQPHMQLRIELLGTFRAAVDGRDIPAEDWRRARRVVLVKLLALANGHRLRREQAMDALWPDMPVVAASANLRKARA